MSLSSYHRRLVVFLGVASFFEGYNFIALTQLLPRVRADLGLSVEQGGYLFAFVNLGTIAAYLLIRRADRWGRRRLLFVTICGYTLGTLATGLSRTVWDFAFFQFLTRVFLIAEYATSVVIAAEELPAERRGFVIGLIQVFSSLGSIICAAIVPALLATSLSWRAVYLAGVGPLILVAVWRRGLRESARFAAVGASGAARPLLAILRGPYRRRVLELALIWGLTYACAQNAVQFWKDFVLSSRGLTEAQAGGAVAIAAVASIPMLLAVGWLIDRLGRRPAAAIIFPLLAVGVAGAYTLHGRWPLTAALVLAMFGVSAVLPVMNALTAELFPTELRGDAFAWANNLLGRVTYVLSPAIVGVVAERTGYGLPMTVASLLPLVALGLILAWIPETGGKELEETSAV